MLTSRDVAAASFPIVKWRVGYEIDEVTAMLVGASETLDSHERRVRHPAPVTAAQASGALFHPTKFRDGFDRNAVDEYLDRVREALRRYEGR
jgi:hypothetical protein